MIYIGTASWNIPKEHKSSFPSDASQLEQYAQVFNAVEINSSFYKDHQLKTYQRWATSVPKDFRFSVKLSKAFTHEQELKLGGEKDLGENLECILGLGGKLGALLVQIPPSLAYQEKDAFLFFQKLREICKNKVVFEPRHVSWLQSEALALLQQFDIHRVFADPESKATNPTWSINENLFYYRLHGSPQVYKSNYEPGSLYALKKKFAELKPRGDVWCIFDNTTYGHATKNALELQKLTHKNHVKETLSLADL